MIPGLDGTKRTWGKIISQEVFKKYIGIFAILTKGVLGWELYEKSGINMVPYQHFTNSIENYFSMLKSLLYKVSEEG